MPQIPLSELAKIPQIDYQNLRGRGLASLTFFVDGEWHLWVPTDAGLIRMKGWPAEGFYFAARLVMVSFPASGILTDGFLSRTVRWEESHFGSPCRNHRMPNHDRHHAPTHRPPGLLQQRWLRLAGQTLKAGQPAKGQGR